MRTCVISEGPGCEARGTKDCCLAGRAIVGFTCVRETKLLTNKARG